MKKVFSILIAVLFLAVSCKSEVKKEEVKFKISGMVCEIGCAKTIATKLYQQEGVLKANVVFKDSLATVEFDANKTNKTKIMNIVKGLAGGQYKTCDIATCKNMASCSAKKQCKEDCKKPCCANKDNVCHEPVKKCEPNCTKPCCANKATKKEGCKANCTKPCCTDKK